MDDTKFKMELQEVAVQLRDAWCADTSADPGGWSAANPAWGQCAVTALVVQDCFGGELMRCTLAGISHYYNRLPDGTVVDLTRHQLPPDVEETESVVRPRWYVLSFTETVRRYGLLCTALNRATMAEAYRPL